MFADRSRASPFVRPLCWCFGQTRGPTMRAPRLAPCLSDSNGYENFARYRALRLPERWTARCQASRGWWIAPDEYFWTPDKFFMAMPDMSAGLLQEIRSVTGGSFYDLPLSEQCSLLGASYSALDSTESAPKQATVEDSVLHRLRGDGWDGERGEGAAFNLAAWSVRRLMEKAGATYWPLRWLSQQPAQERTLESTEVAALRAVVTKLRDDDIAATFSLWKRAPQMIGLSTAANKFGVALDQVLKVWHAMGSKRLIDLCTLEMRGFGTVGWPDLTLHKAGSLRLIEVKSKKDSFTRGQAYWFRNIARPLKWDVEVLHVQKWK